MPATFTTMITVQKLQARWQQQRAPQPRQVAWWTPQSAYRRIGRAVAWLATGSLLLCGSGLLVASLMPAPEQAGGTHLIVYLHVPVAWASVIALTVMAVLAAIGLWTHSPLATMAPQALAPTGATLAFLALWTGSLSTKPVWGVWWVWNAPLGADVALLLVFLAAMALRALVEDGRRADRVVCWFALASALQLPLQFAVLVGASVLQAAVPSGRRMPSPVPVQTGIALSLLVAGFTLYLAAMALLRMRCVILEHERGADWVARCRNPAE